MDKKKAYTLGELAALLDVELQGDRNCSIHGLATLRQAQPGQLSFLTNAQYVRQLSDCKASAVILAPEFVTACPTNCLVSASPYVTYAKASQLFSPLFFPQADHTSAIHPSAIIHHSADIEAGVSIGPNAIIDENAKIGSGTVIGAGCYVGPRASIGAGCRLNANVTLYHDVSLGEDVIIHSAAVIGADGFGFAFDGERSLKIAQLGSVRIGDSVEIGAGTTIDRGALEDTVIEQGVKIDNQVQVGHNCVIGEHTVICGCSAIAGSTTVGSYCSIGGAVGIVGHLTIADRVMVSAMSLVSKSINSSGVYSSGTGLHESKEWKKNIVRFGQLNDMAKRLKGLEKTLADSLENKTTKE